VVDILLLIRANLRESVAKNLISVVQLGTRRLRHWPAPAAATGRTAAKRKKIGDILLLLEHSPVITLGRNAKAANVIASPELLAQRGVELFECDRGGDVTFHGPEQIVGYPIFDLRDFAEPDGKRKTLGVVEFVSRLEEVLIRTCADLAIPTKRVAGLTGVWTDAQCDDARVETAASAVRRSEANPPERGSEAQGRRHRSPHLPLRHLARLRSQRKHRPQLLQTDHPLRHQVEGSHFDAARTRSFALT